MLGTFDPLCFKLIFISNKFVPSRKFIIQEFVKRGSTVHVMINSTYLVTDELLTFSHRPINGSGQKKPYLGHRFVALWLLAHDELLDVCCFTDRTRAFCC